MSGFGGYCPLPIRLGGSATEGWPASQHARAGFDLTAVVRTLPFAWITITMRSGDGNNPTLVGYNSMPGVGTLWAPTLLKLSDGSAKIAWGAAFSDAYERPEPLALRHVKATPVSASARIATSFINDDLCSVNVYLFDNTGSPVNDTVTVRVT